MIVEVQKIDISYDAQKVIDQLSFEVSEGEKVAITGASGMGKSTILHALAGFTPIQSGKIKLFNQDLNPANVAYIRQQMAWVPQETSIRFDTVKEMIDVPHSFSANAGNAPSISEIRLVFDALSLPISLLEKSPQKISGGQRQRILLASSLLLKKQLLLTDEPTSALDEENRNSITDYVLGQKNLTVIAATHDAYWMEKSDKIIELL